MDKTVTDHGRGRCRGGICHIAVTRRRPPLLFVPVTVRDPSSPNLQVSLATLSQVLSCLLLCCKGGTCGESFSCPTEKNICKARLDYDKDGEP